MMTHDDSALEVYYVCFGACLRDYLGAAILEGLYSSELYRGIT